MRPLIDEDEIARHLEQALASGELQGSPSFGRPLPDDPGWEATPVAFRMPFKVMKNAGYRPPEITLLRRRSELATAVQACPPGRERDRLQAELSDLEQALALRLESLRLSQRL